MLPAQEVVGAQFPELLPRCCCCTTEGNQTDRPMKKGKPTKREARIFRTVVAPCIAILSFFLILFAPSPVRLIIYLTAKISIPGALPICTR